MIHFFVTKRKIFGGAMLLAAAGFMALPVQAQPHGRPYHHGGAQGHVHPHGHHYNKWPQATLQAQARSEVAHDTVHIYLANEIAGDTQEAVAQKLTAAMKTATGRALKDAGDNIKVKTGSFSVWPMNDKDGNISNWRARGEITLESKDFVAASELAAGLSDLMSVSSISFSVSPQARALEEQKLLEQAAQAFRDRAHALAEALGYAGYTLRTVDLGGAGVQYETAARGFAAPAMLKADSIPLEGGTETVTVSISGSVFLGDEKAETAQ